ncbi:MAG: hypothetical protein QOI12_4594 [Alphaproteobacteria bacterium]|jgi:hypothetical protein|nr:hypothetical protein [Alphaproteobacteria bacterium]
MSTNDKPDGHGKRIVRSKYYGQFIATNFGLRINDNLCELGFAYETSEAEQEILLEQGAAVLTPRSLKTLSLLLASAISAFEEANGEIKVAPGKLAQLQKVVDDSVASARAKKSKGEAAN